jgi:hypothetical protein
VANDYASEGGHWYKDDGTPCYEVMAKATGLPRPTTLRDARKLGLYVAVSTIAKMRPAYELTDWKVRQAAKLADANPREDGEELEDYGHRILRLHNDEGRKIMDLGSAIHGCIEKHLVGEQYDMQAYGECVRAALADFDRWAGLDGNKPEKSFAHHYGYGGKCDLHKPGFVCDFKTKDFGEGQFPGAYGNHAMQLSAYREGLGMPSARCAIIFVSTTSKGLTHLVEVAEEELAKGWKQFCLLLKYWKIEKGYYPGKELK